MGVNYCTAGMQKRSASAGFGHVSRINRGYVWCRW